MDLHRTEPWPSVWLAGLRSAGDAGGQQGWEPSGSTGPEGSHLVRRPAGRLPQEPGPCRPPPATNLLPRGADSGEETPPSFFIVFTEKFVAKREKLNREQPFPACRPRRELSFSSLSLLGGRGTRVLGPRQVLLPWLRKEALPSLSLVRKQEQRWDPACPQPPPPQGHRPVDARLRVAILETPQRVPVTHQGPHHVPPPWETPPQSPQSQPDAPLATAPSSRHLPCPLRAHRWWLRGPKSALLTHRSDCTRARARGRVLTSSPLPRPSLHTSRGPGTGGEALPQGAGGRPVQPGTHGGNALSLEPFTKKGAGSPRPKKGVRLFSKGGHSPVAPPHTGPQGRRAPGQRAGVQSRVSGGRRPVWSPPHPPPRYPAPGTRGLRRGDLDTEQSPGRRRLEAPPQQSRPPAAAGACSPPAPGARTAGASLRPGVSFFTGSHPLGHLRARPFQPP